MKGRIDSIPSLSTHPSLDPLLLEHVSSPAKSTKLYAAGRWVSRQWKETTREVLADLRDGRSWRPFLVLLFLSWIGFLLFAITTLGASSYGYSLQGALNTACKPDDSFTPFANDYSPWGSSGFFQITLAFGPLDFTPAKVIDICWDVLVGRGGQAALAMLSWHVFSHYVTTSMDHSPVTYRTFWVVFLHQEPTFFSIWHLLRDFISFRRLSSIVAMVFMIMTMIFVLVFPTLASAMTGYTPVTKAFIQNDGERLIPFSDFKVLAYVIHDGYRINMTTDAYVTRPLDYYYDDPVVWHGNERLEYYGCYNKDECGQVNAASRYVSQYGFFGNNNTKSTWQNKTLPAPALNISAYYIPPGGLFGNNWTDPQTQQRPFNDLALLTYLLQNQTYPVSYIESRGTCQPVLNQYQWGFSFTQLFIVVAILFIWTIGISIMWLRARHRLPLRGHPEVPKGWKAVILLADAMDKELMEADIDAHALRDQQVKNKIQKYLQGGSVRFDAHLTRKKVNIRREIRNWFKHNRLLELTYVNRWWLIGIILSVVPVTMSMMTGIYSQPGGIFLLAIFGCAILGILSALAVGSTLRSRLFVTTSWVLAGLVVFIGVCASDVLERVNS
ncbi:hypothetical protein F4821DRAFT_245572 [Hypoxylon rubiginosum]|uniref:Uncharacterized protein n=1 Tax=Hypoxylon rubiginosum TaxID=110542 RepID=A0ACC0CRI4_9PEZI|nr:hypothetical protein F4821DRAFT_245572 [Hypoxylon rubiginosum]